MANRVRKKESSGREVGKRNVDLAASPAHASDSCTRVRPAKNLPLTGKGATRTGVRGKYAEGHEWAPVGKSVGGDQKKEVLTDDTREKYDVEINQIGRVQELTKGELNGKRMYCWEYTAPCIPNECALWDRCSWRALSRKTPNNTCLLRWKYVKEMEQCVLTDYGSTMTQTQMWQLGMHLVPLYQELVSLKIFRASLRTDELFSEWKGLPKVHPVIGLISSTMKTIAVVMREMGLGGVVGKVGEKEKGLSAALIAGDPSYYATLLEEEDEEMLN
jgi:hypothetical protein